MSNLQTIFVVAAAVTAGILATSFQSGAQNQSAAGVAPVATVQGTIWIIIGSQVWVCENKVCLKQNLT